MPSWWCRDGTVDARSDDRARCRRRASFEAEPASTGAASALNCQVLCECCSSSAGGNVRRRSGPDVSSRRWPARSPMWRGGVQIAVVISGSNFSGRWLHVSSVWSAPGRTIWECSALSNSLALQDFWRKGGIVAGQTAVPWARVARVPAVGSPPGEGTGGDLRCHGMGAADHFSTDTAAQRAGDRCRRGVMAKRSTAVCLLRIRG